MVKIIRVLAEPPKAREYESPHDTYKCEVFSLTAPCKTPFVAHFDRLHYKTQLIRERLIEALPKELWHDLEELESLNYEDGSNNGFETGYEVGHDAGDGE